MAFGNAGELPTEFRLFVRGWNETENGRYLFDDVAAQSVMSAFKQWGVDLAIDLEHQQLDGATADPTARDARGWCRLELRPDGSLWAVGVTWTPDGAARLSERRQRYVSPAFEVDPKTKRVAKIVNVAIVAMPATHNTPALVAASLNGAGMDPKQVAAALDALMAGDSEKCMELLKGIIAAAAGADPDAATEDAPPPAGDGGADEATESAAPPAPPAQAPAVPPADKKTEAAASARRLAKLTGKSTVVEALDEVEVWRASYLERETERTTLAAERATLELAERRRLCVDLIQIGAEYPATVWTAATANSPMQSRWLAMPIAELRSHTTAQRAARGKPRAPTPPRGAASASGDPDASVKTFSVEGKTVSLSAREIAIADEAKCDHATFALLKSRRTNT